MIHFSGISKQHDPQVLFRNASLQILPGSRSGLVGPNGAKKTSIFRLIMGEEEFDSGEITKARNCVCGYFPQDVGAMSGRSALQEVMSASEAVIKLGMQIRELEAAMCEPMADLLERYGNIQTEFEHRGGYNLESRAQVILTGLGIGPDEYDRPVEAFSGGWKMRIALAKILSIAPDVLLLDEPTNHLDIQSRETLLAALQNFSGTVVLVSHDRHFLRSLINRVFEIDHGEMRVYNGNYDYYLEKSGREHRAA
ncbi:MAG: ABC-F family ATP-binding cassette domain-containing protein [Syntrophales bacterium]